MIKNIFQFNKLSFQRTTLVFCVASLSMVTGCDKFGKKDGDKVELESAEISADKVCKDPVLSANLKKTVKSRLSQQSSTFAIAHAQSNNIDLNPKSVISESDAVDIKVGNTRSAKGKTSSNGLVSCEANVSMTVPAETFDRANGMFADNGQKTLEQKITASNMKLNNNTIIDEAFVFVVNPETPNKKVRIVGQSPLLEVASDVVINSTLSKVQGIKLKPKADQAVQASSQAPQESGTEQAQGLVTTSNSTAQVQAPKQVATTTKSPQAKKPTPTPTPKKVDQAKQRQQAEARRKRQAEARRKRQAEERRRQLIAEAQREEQQMAEARRRQMAEARRAEQLAQARRAEQMAKARQQEEPVSNVDKEKQMAQAKARRAELVKKRQAEQARKKQQAEIKAQQARLSLENDGKPIFVEAKPEPKPQPKPEPKPQPKPEPKPQPKPEPKPKESVATPTNDISSDGGEMVIVEEAGTY